MVGNAGEDTWAPTRLLKSPQQFIADAGFLSPLVPQFLPFPSSQTA
jgi:hypothetical protein